MDGAALLVKTLERLRVKYIFGIPGDTKDNKGKTAEALFFKELKKSSKIKFIRTTHEQSAGFMADTYGRLTGKAGVCYTTLGPGATNIGTAIKNAHSDRSPLVCITSQLPKTSWHVDTHQFVNMKKEFSHKSKLQITIENVNEIPQKLQLAFKIAEEERPGPVHIVLPVDILDDSFNSKIKISSKINRQKKNFPNISSVIKEIKRAQFPIILVGGAVIRQNATNELIKFMGKFNIYALSTFQGKGAIPSNHPLYLGVLSRHLPKTAESIRKSDLLINIGYDYAEGIKPKIWSEGIRKKIINIDTSTRTGQKFYRPDIDIVCDYKYFFKKINSSNLTPKKYKYLPFHRFDPKNYKFSKEDFPIDPLNLIKKLRVLLDNQDIIIVDVGEHKQYMGLFFEIYLPKTINFSNGQSTMGFSVPGAIAAKILNKDKRVVAIVGDGSFQMTASEFITAVNYNLPITVIILNDGAYGIIKYEQEKVFGGSFGVDFRNPDFVKLAQAYGGEGFRINSAKNLTSTLKKALNSEKVAIVDVPITYKNRLW